MQEECYKDDKGEHSPATKNIMETKDKTPFENKIAKDQRIMRILKVSELRYSVGTTNRGPLDIMIRFGEDKYDFMFDNTPVDDGTPGGKERNQALLKLFNLNG